MPATPGWVVPLRELAVTHMRSYDNGDLLLTGFQTSIQGKFGDVYLDETEDWYAALMARIDSDGGLVWYRVFDTSSYSSSGFITDVTASAIGPAGESVIVGNYSSPVDFGDGGLKAPDGHDIFIASFTPEGKLSWSRSVTGPGQQYGLSAAISADGKVFVGGAFEGAIAVGDEMLMSNGETDILLARYSSSGDPEWARSWGGRLHDSAAALAVDHAGDLVMLARVYDHETDFGNGPLTDIVYCTTNSVVAKFHPDGSNVWAVAAPSTAGTTASSALTRRAPAG